MLDIHYSINPQSWPAKRVIALHLQLEGKEAQRTQLGLEPRQSGCRQKENELHTMGMPFAQRTQVDNNVLGWCPLGNVFFYLQRVIVTLGFGSAKSLSLEKGVVNRGGLGFSLPDFLCMGGGGVGRGRPSCCVCQVHR